MSTPYQKLSDLLKQLFQSNQADLDFGIYRIINQRRTEINKFLDEDLLPQVQAAFSEYQSYDKEVLEEDLQEAIESAKRLGVEPDNAPKVQQIRERMSTYSVNVNDLENQVYSALYNFFRRYYDEGDFISQRRYKEGVYAIPYEGEEVKLYWANHDQYYIKTSEYFRDYSFKLPSGKRAHFKLVEADTEKDNRKEIDDSKRRFVLAEEPLAWQDGEVVIRFEFRPEKAKQSKCNEKTLKTLFGLRKGLEEQSQKDALTELAHPAPTEGNPERTLLEKHLEDYTRRNTQDYFIHKDLGKFLRRELDFYIKNEIMHLDNIENESAPRVEEYLSKIKVIRQIAHKIIDFLAQIEDFQKKLWLKKKFVVETNYCITLDRIPEELYPEIAANDAQREEWVRLFAINKIKKDLVTAGYSNPLTIEFLKANPFLVLDTKFFNQKFKYKVLASIEDIDEFLNGLLVHSENFQALNLLQGRYANTINCIYIDPPYNAKSSEILYKNTFKHSSWLSLMANRLSLGKQLLQDDFVHIIAIDEIEQEVLGQLINIKFPNDNKVCISIVHNPRGQQGKNISYTHDFAYFIYPSDEKKYIQDVERTEIDSRNLRDSGTESNRSDAATCFYPIFVEEGKIVGIGEVPADDFHPSSSNVKRGDGVLEVWPLDDKGNEKKWRYSVNSVNDIFGKLEAKKGRKSIQIYFNQDMGTVKSLWNEAKYDASEYGTKVLQSILGAESSKMFSYPKSIFTVMDSLKASDSYQGNEIFLDYFAGSGTTGHAVINLNRKDGRSRKYLLVEMGQYFDTVLMPRIKKVIYSEDWKNSRPISRKGSSHAFKYIQLESFEDTLNNLTLKRSETTQTTLLDETAFGEDYLLHYMLDFESQNSLLDLERFETPFDYQLQIASSTVGETEATPVDLVETFNYLLGLHVQSIRKIEGTVVVRGTTRDEKQVLVIWRTVPEMDNDQLNTFFETYLADESENITDIYVNGDNNLANIRPDDQHWKVHLTEESFHRLMFEEGKIV
jgi:adenine-specific DNA-methyltransferase